MAEDGVERIDTGIDGLNELTGGGIPQNAVVLVSGGPGCGKTMFCSQFLAKGLENDEGGLYITMEEQPEEIIESAELIGFDFEDAVDDGSLKVEYMNPAKGSGFLNKIEYYIEDVEAERIVLDSVSVMGMHSDSQARIRERLYKIMKRLKRSGATIVMTAEIPDSEPDAVSRFEVEEFVADGVVVLYYTGTGSGSFRSLEVRKMRKTDHTPGTYPFEIEEDAGLDVSTTEI
jgi:circadian clock protein KaiC